MIVKSMKMNAWMVPMRKTSNNFQITNAPIHNGEIADRTPPDVAKVLNASVSR